MYQDHLQKVFEERDMEDLSNEDRFELEQRNNNFKERLKDAFVKLQGERDEGKVNKNNNPKTDGNEAKDDVTFQPLTIRILQQQKKARRELVPKVTQEEEIVLVQESSDDEAVDTNTTTQESSVRIMTQRTRAASAAETRAKAKKSESKENRSGPKLRPRIPTERNQGKEVENADCVICMLYKLALTLLIVSLSSVF